MADDARLSSPVTGMSLTSVNIRGAFGGSKLVLSSLSGMSKGGGKVTGSGSFDFSGAGIGIDLSLQADNAVILNRDDIGARSEESRGGKEGGRTWRSRWGA